MKLHKESKGTLVVAILFVAFIAAISIYYLKIWSLIILLPLLVMLGLIFWFFRVPKRAILDHTENVIAPVDGKVVMIKEVVEDEFIKGKCIQISIFMSPLNVHICRYPVVVMSSIKNTIQGNILWRGTRNPPPKTREQLLQ